MAANACRKKRKSSGADSNEFTASLEADRVPVDAADAESTTSDPAAVSPSAPAAVSPSAPEAMSPSAPAAVSPSAPEAVSPSDPEAGMEPLDAHSTHCLILIFPPNYLCIRSNVHTVLLYELTVLCKGQQPVSWCL